MAVIRMQHPEHGFDTSYDSAQQARMEAAGWKKITNAEFKALIAAKTAKVEEEVVEAPKKPGRPKKA